MSGSNSRPVAVVTGASSGIGAVYAERLAARGYDLILVARRTQRLKALSAKLSVGFGVKIEALAADLTKEDDLTHIERILATNAAVSLLVNNAGNGKLSSTIDMSAKDTAATIALNITALTRLSKAVLPGFLARNAGAIINVASVMALHSLPLTSLYSGTKAFVLNFSRGLQEELVGTGVKVQVVLPAGTATEFYDNAGIPISAFDPAIIMTAEDMVDAALSGFDHNEAITIPSVHDLNLWEAYDSARIELFTATQTGNPAPRYL
ncbi:SDR family NAD(P)-dependent oxidoreductase [Serratia ficaria]|uniref:SDR family NAD(P)-dependent oxidoreductase n=1 Tax=Serratia ficaria TaxID=61651 RepID=UPI00077C7ADC|nr:SDR family oxidoreductase [Serratia ficaria]